MKTLYLLRHAKSSWDDSSLSDFDRPLSPRGKRDALMMGWIVKNMRIQPDLILCSPSKRTKATLKRITTITKRKKDTKVVFVDNLYEASLQYLISTVQSFNDTVDTAMIIGHNP
jgi:phosphohistidine phosphatase